MQQECIRQPAEPFSGLGVPGGDGLFAQIAARHHERLRKARSRLKQQVVERSVRQHHTQGVLIGGQIGGDWRGGPAPQNDDGALPALQQRPLRRADVAMPLDRAEVGHH